MKLNFSALASVVLLVVSASALPMASQEAQAGCTLTGNYVNSNDIATRSNVVVSNLQAPAGVTLDLTKVKPGATVTFQGTTTFGKELWGGPLVLLTGTGLTVNGAGVLDGQGYWYWQQKPNVTRPVFFRLSRVDSSTLSGFTLKNSPFRTFSTLNSVGTHLTGLTLDSSAGDNHAKNTDGFDLSDGLAMQSSVDTVFSGNSRAGGRGISVGSIGRGVVDESRQRTAHQGHLGQKGLVTGISYTKNVLMNIKNAIVIHSNYVDDGFKGNPTNQVTIRSITIAGLSGTATNIYDILVNPSAVSDRHFSGITVSGAKGKREGQPSSITC